LAWGSGTPLGVAGGAGGVQHGEHVVGAHRPPPVRHLPRRGGEPFAAELQEGVPGQVRLALGAAVQHDHLAQPGQPAEDRPPALQVVRAAEHRDLGAHVGGDERDLLGAERAVDRARGRAGVHRAEVGEHVLAAVHHHDRDDVAGFDADRREPGGDPQHPLARLPVAEGAPAVAVGVGVGRGVGVTARDLRELSADGTARDLLFDLGPRREDPGVGHVASSRRAGRLPGTASHRRIRSRTLRRDPR
jgi:hypothetical protein